MLLSDKESCIYLWKITHAYSENGTPFVFGSSFLLAALGADPWREIGMLGGFLLAFRVSFLLPEKIRTGRVQQAIERLSRCRKGSR